MGAKVYDTTLGAFVDAHVPLINTGGGVFSESEGKVYNGSEWVDAWSSARSLVLYDNGTGSENWIKINNFGLTMRNTPDIYVAGMSKQTASGWYCTVDISNYTTLHLQYSFHCTQGTNYFGPGTGSIVGATDVTSGLQGYVYFFDLRFQEVTKTNEEYTRPVADLLLDTTHPYLAIFAGTFNARTASDWLSVTKVWID